MNIPSDAIRINNILKRDFERIFDLALFIYIVKHNQTDEAYNNFTIDNLNIEKIKEADIDLYYKSFQLSDNDIIDCLLISEIDKRMGEFPSNKKSELREAYVEKHRNCDSIKELLNQPRQCYYCGISELDIEEILKKLKDSDSTIPRFHTKRFFWGRGRALEIDRIDSRKGYESENMVFACYWCNNAKTDEFTCEEFKTIIGPAIRGIWETRFLSIDITLKETPISKCKK